MNHLRVALLVSVPLLMHGVPAHSTADTFEQCVVSRVRDGDPNSIAKDILEKCRIESIASRTPSNERSLGSVAVTGGFVTERERETTDHISAYRPNYMVYSTSRYPSDSTTQDDGQPWNKSELMSQVSIKAPLWIFSDDEDLALFFAYTNRSWWQIKEESSPFRDINHEPEVFLRRYLDEKTLGPFALRGFDIGYNHQSNGRSGEASRSWNRITFNTSVQYDDLMLALSAWYQIPDSDSLNPYMYRYYGYGDLLAAYAPSALGEIDGVPKHVFSLLVRPGTETFSYEATWSWLLNKRGLTRIHAQYFDGYGDSLIDYDKRTTRFGIGVSLNQFDFGPRGIP